MTLSQWPSHIQIQHFYVFEVLFTICISVPLLGGLTADPGVKNSDLASNDSQLDVTVIMLIS